MINFFMGKGAHTPSTQILHLWECVMSEDIKTKKCRKCGEIKPITDFYKKETGKYGVEGRCKLCRNTRGKEHHEKNKDKINKRHRKRYQLTKDNVTAHQREYYSNNKDTITKRRKKEREGNRYKERSKLYQQNNKEKIAKRKKKHYLNNRDKILEQKKDYLARNRENIYLRHKEKLKNNPGFKLRHNLSTRIQRALKNQSTKRLYKYNELLGCTIQEAREHLEKQFQPGMTWENHGLRGWHIDHIKSCASFDLTDPDQQKACFHYTNLQPLWAFDNLSKGAKNTVKWNTKESA